VSPDDLSGSAFGSEREEGAGNRFAGVFDTGAPWAVPAVSDNDKTTNATLEREHADPICTFRFRALDPAESSGLARPSSPADG
jgi:hypothetical protein